MHKNGRFSVALVGQPNVGKSVIMNLLTGAGAVVSNYPGTTVEVTEGTMRHGRDQIRLVDAPGTYSLHSDTPEQRVTQRVILEDEVNLILNIVDARNLARNLYLTMQLLDLEVPMIVVMNQMDMAEEVGIAIDVPKLSKLLGVPVIPMVASKGIGLAELRSEIVAARTAVLAANDDSANGSRKVSDYLGKRLKFTSEIESVLGVLQSRIEEIVTPENGKHGHHTSRALAIHLLEHDRLDEDLLDVYPEIRPVVERLQQEVASGHPPCSGCFRGCAFCPMSDGHPASLTCLERTAASRDLAESVAKVKVSAKVTSGLRVRLERLLDAPLTGLPLLALVLYVSVMAIGWFMEHAEEWVSVGMMPVSTWFSALAEGKSGLLRALFLAIPGGILLPFAIVMPAMIGIYSAMASLEDSGLLPRIAVMMDKVMSFFGLPGQSTIPLLLGFGCKAPAILGTRTLPGKQQRFIVSALMAITVPCAASLGIITGLGTAFGAKLSVIYASMAVMFVVLGVILGKTSAGVERHLILEIPPLRVPVMSNVVAKTWMRLQGFFGHVLPLLVLTSVGVQVVLDLGLMSGLARLNPWSLRWLGVSGESLVGVAISVIQKYMGPMVLMNLPLGAREATIAGAMVALSMPCLPVSVLIGRELGWGALVKIFGLALTVSLAIGATLNILLPVF